MPTLTLTLDSFSLKSTWRAWLEMGETQYSTPTTAGTDKTFDLSSIPAGALITSATLSGATNGAGDSRAKYGGISKNVTNAFERSVSDWLSGMTAFGNLTVRFTFQAYGGAGSNGTYSRTCSFSGVTLAVEYTLPYSKPGITALSLSKTTAHPGESVTLSWTGENGGSNAVTAYQVYRATTVDGAYALLDTVTSPALSGSLSVSAPTPGGAYYYKVKPLGTVSGYDGDLSAAVAVTVVCTVPMPPTALTLSPAATHPNGASTLSFSGAGGGENNPITGYRVYRALSADGAYALLWSGTGGSVTVYAPNDDGAQYFYKVAAVGQYLTGGLSQTYATLTASCAQTSGFSLSASNVDAGGSVTLTLSGNGLAAAHVMTVTFGNQTLTERMAAGTTSKSVTIPLAWLAQIPGAVSGAANVNVSTAGGGSVNRPLTVSAGSGVKPTISGGTASPTSVDVPAAWNVYVAGHSAAALALPAALSASGAYGSTVTGYRIECAGMVKSGVSLPLSLTTGTLFSGTYQARFIVVDSRGREGVEEKTITVQPYAVPYSDDLSAARSDSGGTPADEGTYIRLTGTILCASCAGNNAVSVNVKYKRDGAAAWTDAGAMTGGSPMIIAGSAAITDNYTVLVTMTDRLGVVSERELSVPKSAFALHFLYSGGQMGAAFGKAAQAVQLLDSAWPARIRGALTVDGALSAGSLSDPGAWRSALGLNSAANIVSAGGGAGLMLAALGLSGLTGGVIASYGDANGGYIKLGTSAGGVVLQWRRCAASGAMTAWNDVYYMDASPGNWYAPMAALLACFTSLGQDSATAPGWPGTIYGANAVSAGTIRIFQASATAVNRIATAFALGTWTA